MPVKASTAAYQAVVSLSQPHCFYNHQPQRIKSQIKTSLDFLQFVFEDHTSTTLLSAERSVAIKEMVRFLELYQDIVRLTKNSELTLESYDSLKASCKHDYNHLDHVVVPQHEEKYTTHVGLYHSSRLNTEEVRHLQYLMQRHFPDGYDEFAKAIHVIEQSIRSSFFPSFYKQDGAKVYSTLTSQSLSKLKKALELLQNEDWASQAKGYICLHSIKDDCILIPGFMSILEPYVAREIDTLETIPNSHIELFKQLALLPQPCKNEYCGPTPNAFFELVVNSICQQQEGHPNLSVQDIDLMLHIADERHYTKSFLMLADALSSRDPTRVQQLKKLTSQQSINDKLFIEVEFLNRDLMNIRAFCYSMLHCSHHHSLLICKDSKSEAAYFVLARTYQSPTFDYLRLQYLRYLLGKGFGSTTHIELVTFLPLTDVTQVSLLLENLSTIESTTNHFTYPKPSDFTLESLKEVELLSKLSSSRPAFSSKVLSSYSLPLLQAFRSGYTKKQPKIPVTRTSKVATFFEPQQRKTEEDLPSQLADTLTNDDPRVLFEFLVTHDTESQSSRFLAPIRKLFHSNKTELWGELNLLLEKHSLPAGHFAYANAYFYIMYGRELSKSALAQDAKNNETPFLEINFSGCQLNINKLKRIAELAQKQFPIRTLNLSNTSLIGCDDTLESMEQILSEILTVHPLQHLDLSHNKFSNPILTRVCNTVSNNKNRISHLHINMSNCWLVLNEARFTSPLFSMLENCEGKVEVDLSGNFISLYNHNLKHMLKSSASILMSYVDRPVATIYGKKFISKDQWTVTLMANKPGSVLHNNEHSSLAVEGIAEGALRFIFTAELRFSRATANEPAKPIIVFKTTFDLSKYRSKNSSLKCGSSSCSANDIKIQKHEPLSISDLLRYEKKDKLVATIESSNIAAIQRMMRDIRTESEKGLGQEYAMMAGFSIDSPENKAAATNCNKWALEHLRPFLPKNFAQGERYADMYYYPSTTVNHLIKALEEQNDTTNRTANSSSKLK